MNELTVRFTWKSIDALALDATGKLRFPAAPARAGLYRFDLSSPVGLCAYIGETDTLNRRFQHYRTPGATQSTNIRLNAMMRDVVASGGNVAVSIIADGVSATTGRGEHLAALSLKSVRVLFEHAAIYAARENGAELVNL